MPSARPGLYEHYKTAREVGRSRDRNSQLRVAIEFSCCDRAGAGTGLPRS